MPTTTDPTAHAYQILCRGLKNHAALHGQVRTWRFRDGSAKADEPPVASQCPWVRLTPVSRPAEWYTRRSIAQPLEILIETAVTQGDFPASAALWGLIMRALFNREDTDSARLRLALGRVGVSQLDIVKPAFPDKVADYGDGPLLATGSITLSIYLRTR